MIYIFIKEVKGLNNKCVYNTVYNIEVTCRLILLTKGKPLIVLKFLQNKKLEYQLALGTTYHFQRTTAWTFFFPTLPVVWVKVLTVQ